MVKRTDLLRKIADAASAANIEFTLVREGGSHSIFQCGSQRVVVPRHREINELTTRGILRDLDDQLGKDWWK
ncbi:MAG: type II toxin-antitoxin system HicA family toxin [Dactylosporangium sp.]|nr:type II toxin-antitoxin system HicA family toxin [Dactylosporangium sp.]NNJ60970.1 type II toxin-antitoxin system HicA family toxin [Dactylosporangium sp.]